jgi:hypothetical protein
MPARPLYKHCIHSRRPERIAELLDLERELYKLLGVRTWRVELVRDALTCYRSHLLRRELSVQAPGQRKRTTNTPDGSRPEMDIVLDDPGAYPPPGG